MKNCLNKEEIKEHYEEIFVELPSSHWMAYVGENMVELKEAGLYEEYLLQAYTGATTNFARWEQWILNWLFERADRDKLLKAGDPLPGPGPFTLYRGVAGHGAFRKVRGISWTEDFEKALWFAQRFKIILDKPMVYETVVQREQILAYSNSRGEKEFLCLLPSNQKLRRVWPEMLTEMGQARHS